MGRFYEYADYLGLRHALVASPPRHAAGLSLVRVGDVHRNDPDRAVRGCGPAHRLWTGLSRLALVFSPLRNESVEHPLEDRIRQSTGHGPVVLRRRRDVH